MPLGFWIAAYSMTARFRVNPRIHQVTSVANEVPRGLSKAFRLHTHCQNSDVVIGFPYTGTGGSRHYESRVRSRKPFMSDLQAGRSVESLPRSGHNWPAIGKQKFRRSPLGLDGCQEADPCKGRPLVRLQEVYPETSRGTNELPSPRPRIQPVGLLQGGVGEALAEKSLRHASHLVDGVCVAEVLSAG